MKFKFGDIVQFDFNFTYNSKLYRTGDLVVITDVTKDASGLDCYDIGPNPFTPIYVEANALESVCSIKVSAVSPTTSNSYNLPPLPIGMAAEVANDHMTWEGTDTLWTSKKKCECGCSAVGSDRHSDWCPLYSKVG